MEQWKYDTICCLILGSKNPYNLSKSDKDSLRRTAKHFVLKDGQLYFRSGKSKNAGSQVITTSQKNEVLESCHSNNNPQGPHFDTDDTLAKVSERYYWMGMVYDVKTYCKMCEVCTIESSIREDRIGFGPMAARMAPPTKPLHIVTPLIESLPMGKLTGCKVYLKCDNMQPASSFKLRGIGNRIQKARQSGGKHVICPSGGNAGFAAAYSARKLCLPATIVIPESTPAMIASSIRDEGAEVIIHGKVYDNARTYALKLAEEMDGAIFIEPFDHPDVWEGNSTVILESATQLTHKPGAVVLCVGGGGLLAGVVQGMKEVGWADVPIVAMETTGAESYNAAVTAGKLVTLPDITSLAKSLGALTVCARSLQCYTEHPIISVVVSDLDALNGCLRLLDDHRILVELACGATMAAVYSNVIKDLQEQGRLKQDLQSLLVIACGGRGISLEKLLEYKAILKK